MGNHKKWIAVFLSLVMVLAILAGCGKTEDVDKQQEEVQDSQPQQGDDDMEKDQKEPEEGIISEQEDSGQKAEEAQPEPEPDFFGVEDELPEGVYLIEKYDVSKLRCWSSSLGEAKIVDVEGMPFTKAVQAITRQPAKQVWDIQLTAPIEQPVNVSDTIVIRFYIRAVESESGRIKTACLFEKAGDPYTKSINEAIEVGKEWKKYQFVFTSKETYEPGGANLIFRMGVDQPQIMEIGGLELIHYGREYTPDQFEKVSSDFWYKGREEDAAWRKEAEERIEEIRKGDLKVQVVDAAGKPVEGAKVQVNMKKHAFGFGTAVSAPTLARRDRSKDSKRYSEEIVKLFNMAVIENGLKWSNFENEMRRKETDDAINYLLENGLKIRGHVLVWPSWGYLPNDLQNLKNDKEALKKRINNHIKEEVSYYKGKLVNWDVVNEPYANHDLMDILGEDEILEWFKLAREVDPDARLYLNETGITKSPAVADRAEEILKNAKAKGVKIDGLGIQSHFLNGLEITPPEKLLEILDRFGAYVDEIKVTEMDFVLENDQLEADYLRDLMTAYFSHPKVNGILMWGFWDGAHWENHAPIYTRDWQLRPSGEAFIDLVFNKWWTQEEGQTNDKGEYSTRGFLGEYEIVVEAGGKVQTVSTELLREGTEIKVVLQ